MTIVIDDKDIRDPMCSCGKRGKVFLSAPQTGSAL